MRRPAALLALLTGLLLALPALAVRGDAPQRYAPGQRLHRVAHPEAQALLDRQPAWRAFTEARGPGWVASWDEATGTPVRFWGPGWDVDPALLADDDGAWALGWQILDETAGLLGDVARDDLAPLALDRRAGITTLTFARTWGGLPVEGARVSLRFKADRFVMGGYSSMPGITLDPTPALSPEAARTAALEALGWSPADSRETGAPERVVLPRPGHRFGQIDCRLAWRVELRSDLAPSQKRVWIDAHDGELLAWEEQVRFVDGTAVGSVDDRYPANGLTTAPLPEVELSAGDPSATADEAGAFTIDAGLPADLEWQVGSAWFDIDDAGGPNPVFTDLLTTDGGTVTATPVDPGADEQRALLDVHVALHTVRQWALAVDPAFSWATTEVQVNVNRTDTVCNAWFDGSLNTVAAGAGCTNSGRVADVLFHEYGHGYHYFSIIDGAGAFEASLTEGLGDYLSATITGDSEIAPGFFQSNTNPLRDVEPDRVWPTDVGDVLQTGLILAGALWDLRTALIADLGAEAGVAHADLVMSQIAARAEDIPSAWPEALLADDDNGNLADGTPNLCALIDAFEPHGLVDGGGTAFVFDHQPPQGEQEPDEPIGLTLTATLAYPECAAGELEEVRLLWSDSSDDVDDFEIVDLAPAGDDWTGDVPGIPDGRLLRYRFEAYDTSGSLVAALPEGSVSDPWYGAWVGGLEELFFEDLEGDDGGFVHDLLEGEGEGADDWAWGAPGGQSGDPEQAASGVRIWGNDISPDESWNGAYQPDVHNVLRSPVVEVGDVDRVLLQFRRWLTVEDGHFDQARLRVNGELVWSQYASPSADQADTHHVDHHWAFRSYDVTDLVDDGSVQVEWELQSDAGVEFGGWNLDDVGLYTAGEFVGDDDDDGADDDDSSAGDDDDGGGGGGGGRSRGGCTCASAASGPTGAGVLLLLVLAGFRSRCSGR